MEFRRSRGTGMKKLMEQQQNEADDFWKENKYFGKQEDLEEDSEDKEDYEATSSGRDEFDTDFLDSSSHSDDDEDASDDDNKRKKNKKPIKKKPLPPKKKPAKRAQPKKKP